MDVRRAGHQDAAHGAVARGPLDALAFAVHPVHHLPRRVKLQRPDISEIGDRELHPRVVFGVGTQPRDGVSLAEQQEIPWSCTKTNQRQDTSRSRI